MAAFFMVSGPFSTMYFWEAVTLTPSLSASSSNAFGSDGISTFVASTLVRAGVSDGGGVGGATSSGFSVETGVSGTG